MKKIFYLLAASALLFNACSSDDDGPGPVPQKPAPSTKHTALVYLAIDNNFSLDIDYKQKLEALRANWSASYDGNLLVYADAGNGHPVLVQVYQNTNGDNVADTVKNYNTPHNSADPANITNIMNDVRAGWPAEKHGMIYLSHATGWLPQGTLINPRSIGSDWDEKTNSSSPNETDLKDFAEALPYNLEYVIFDACFMGAVEVAYELKDKVKYVVGSPAEVLVPGFVYTTMMSHLMKPTPDVAGVAKDFYNYYNSMSGVTRSATISVVETAKMTTLAEISKELLSGIDGEKEVELSAIQNFRPGNNMFYFDFGDYVRALNPDRYDEFISALNECLIYKANTPSYYSAANGQANPIREDAFCGLTTYIPQKRFPYMNGRYTMLKWAEAINNDTE